MQCFENCGPIQKKLSRRKTHVVPQVKHLDVLTFQVPAGVVVLLQRVLPVQDDLLLLSLLDLSESTPDSEFDSPEFWPAFLPH